MVIDEAQHTLVVLDSASELYAETFSFNSTCLAIARVDYLIRPDLPRASFISYLTVLAIKTNKRMERDDSSRGVSRGLHDLRGNLLVTFQQSTKNCVENDSLGSRSATSDWPNYFSLTCFTSNFTLAERRGAGLTQRVKERFGVP